MGTEASRTEDRGSWLLIAAAIAAVLGASALIVELTVSHGRADIWWGASAVALLVTSYALRQRARSILIYRPPEQPVASGASRGMDELQ